MSRSLISFISVLPFLLAGCGSPNQLAFKILARPSTSAFEIGPLHIDVIPIDTGALKEDHPFCWRGDTFAGFMLFDVRVTNIGKDRDILCLFGHTDFPDTAAPRATVQHLLPGVSTSQPVGADQLRLADLGHEQASVLLSTGYRFAILNHGDFAARYARMMQQEMERASGWNYVPYAGPFIASHKIKKSAEEMQRRQFRAEQKVLRPGVVVAGSTVRGYLVFAWPEDMEPGEIVLRLPIQPGHAAEIHFNVVRASRIKS